METKIGHFLFLFLGCLVIWLILSIFIHILFIPYCIGSAISSFILVLIDKD